MIIMSGKSVNAFQGKKIGLQLLENIVYNF